MSEIQEFLEEFEVYQPRVTPGPTSRAKDFVPMPGLFGPGIYALMRDGEVVYVGKAQVLIQRLYAHWNAMCRLKSGKPAFSRGPKGFVFSALKIIPCAASDLDKLERQMIARYQPRYNKTLVPKDKVTLEQVGFDLTRLGITQTASTPVYRRRL